MTSPWAVNEPAVLANVNVLPAGRTVFAGTVARALAGPAVFEPHSDQPPMSTVDPETLRISTTSSLPPPVPPKATWEITTDVAACAAGAPTARTSAADASARRRYFTMQESFPEGNPREQRQTVAPHR